MMIHGIRIWYNLDGWDVRFGGLGRLNIGIFGRLKLGRWKMGRQLSYCVLQSTV